MKTHSIDAVEARVRLACEAVHGLTLLRRVIDDPIARNMLNLLNALTATEPDAVTIARTYSNAFRALAEAANTEEWVPGIPDAWQAYLITRLLDDTNPWSTRAERSGSTGIPTAIRGQAQRDLQALHLLFNLSAEDLWRFTRERVTAALPSLSDAWVPWYNLADPQTVRERPGARDALCHQIIECGDWATLTDELTDYWARHGTGPFAHYHVLRWQGREEGLRGIAHPDPIRLTALIGYEREQARLRENTERFLLGLPAHDTVLYGAPGTGKSSTVKALANEYADRGLRLIEVSKDLVHDLPSIVALLRGRAPRFLLFIDDLSFEEHETQYKALKVLLEGAAEARPENALIYATTNRLNLIRENFSDRGKPTNDVHWRDTMDEKNALIARFGLRVTFALPDQQHYLDIATGLALQRGISMPEEDLRIRALLWERQHTGRSGRLARQFVDDLESELRYANQ